MPETRDRRCNNPYHKDRFTYRSRTDTYLCPQQKVLTYKDSFNHGNGYRVRRYRANSQECVSRPTLGERTFSKNGRSIRIREHEQILQLHRQLMATVRAKKLYRRRIGIVEPVFGLLKEWHGARRFLLRGRSHVVSEWRLLSIAFNLKSLHAVRRSGISPESPLQTGPQRQQKPWLTAAPRPHRRRLRHFRCLIPVRFDHTMKG